MNHPLIDLKMYSHKTNFFCFISQLYWSSYWYALIWIISGNSFLGILFKIVNKIFNKFEVMNVFVLDLGKISWLTISLLHISVQNTNISKATIIRHPIEQNQPFWTWTACSLHFWNLTWKIRITQRKSGNRKTWSFNKLILINYYGNKMTSSQ